MHDWSTVFTDNISFVIMTDLGYIAKYHTLDKQQTSYSITFGIWCQMIMS